MKKLCHTAEFLKCIWHFVLAHFASDPAGTVHKTAIYLGTFIGGITFTGSLTAFGKLQGLLNSNALNLPGKNAYNITMGLASVGAMGLFMSSSDVPTCMSMLGKCTGETFHVIYWHVPK